MISVLNGIFLFLKMTTIIKRTINNKLFLLLLFTAAFISCQEPEIQPNTPAEPSDVKGSGIIGWIQEEMDIYYYWNSWMPDIDAQKITDPEVYFYELLHADDEFSWITDDAEKLLDETDGIIADLGYSPSFGRFSNTNGVFIMVEYVYKNSAASKAGLKRGDIILAINDTELTMDNYLDLYNQDAYSVTLGKYENGSISMTSQKLSLSAMALQMNPVLHWETKTAGNTKIGYLAYAEFLSGTNDRWLDELGNALNEMKQQGVSELIIDLRYNAGGEVYAARYLASAIAPKTAVEHHAVFVRFDYNEILQNFFLENEGQNSENLFIRFNQNNVNMSLERVIFLTGPGTASASELLIKGLDPYMDVVTIGEKTVGKFYGSMVITDENDPPAHNYAIVPVVLKYQNAEGFTDFIDGLAPDHAIFDDLLIAKPLGSSDDPMVAKAIELITGETVGRARISRSMDYIKLNDQDKIRKGNILIH